MAGPSRLTHLSRRVLASVPELPDGVLVVALSGGADSAVCAWVARQRGGEVSAAHVHHGLPTSDLMLGAAREVAAALGLGLEVHHVKVPAGSSWEDRARRERYAVLEPKIQDTWLLTGHTADDQAETVLLALLRGAGAEGLAGIPERRGRILRPLLGVTRSETRELATRLGLPWRDDPAEPATEPRRTLIRRVVLPDLEGMLNPELRAALARTAGVLAGEGEVLDRLAAEIPWRRRGDAILIASSDLTTRPEAVARRAVRHALRRVRPPHAGSHDEVLAVLEVAGGKRGGAELAGGIRVLIDGALLVIGREGRPEQPTPVRWPIPGRVVFGRWELVATLDPLPPVAFPLTPDRAVLDADVVGAEVEVRPAALGGSVAVPGGSRAVLALLRDAAVSEADRPGWPVVFLEEEVLWVPGVRAASARVGRGTTRYLWLESLQEGWCASARP